MTGRMGVWAFGSWVLGLVSKFRVWSLGFIGFIGFKVEGLCLNLGAWCLSLGFGVLGF